MGRDIHGAKRGRNDACWCGSGLKYKRCHLNRSEQPRVQAADVVDRIRRSSDRRHCSCPPIWLRDCEGAIVKAHSLSRRASLGSVTENGHVYSLVPRVDRLIFRDDFNGQLISARTASTFTGFCGRHDREIFVDLDTGEFNGGDKQTFLSAYRTLCRELFAKAGQIRLFEDAKDLDSGRDENVQYNIQSALFLGTLGARAAIAELEQIKTRFDDALLRGDFSAFSYRNFYFDVPPALVSAGGYNPTHNILAQEIQDLGNITALSENLFFAVLPSNGGFWASFLWPREYNLMRDFVHEVERRGPKVGTIYGTALAFVENTFLRPSVWNALPTDDKQIFKTLNWMGVSDDEYGRLPRCIESLERMYPELASHVAKSD